MTFSFRSSTDPVDTKHLFSMAAGDNEYINEFIDLFLENAEICIALLERHSSANAKQRWEETSQELQNVAKNFGITCILDSCEQALMKSMDSESEKQEIIQKLQKDVELVKDFLEKRKV